MNLIQESYISFVNLNHRKDRLQRMVDSLREVGIMAERTPGRLPSEFPVDKKTQVMRNRTPGAIGCHYSQVSIMEKALAMGKHAWVMEDDLIFCKDFMMRLRHMERFCESHSWDILWLGGTFHINPPHWHKELGRDAEVTEDPRMIRTLGAFCTYAYIVNLNSLELILSGLESLVEVSMGIDWAMIQLQPQLQTFAFVPGCITQYDNQSDIGKGVTRFSGFAKLGPYWYQDWMQDFDPKEYNWHEARIH